MSTLLETQNFNGVQYRHASCLRALLRCLKGFYIELELFVLSYEIHKFITAVVLRKKQSYPKIIQYKSYCGEAAGLAFFCFYCACVYTIISGF